MKLNKGPLVDVKGGFGQTSYTAKISEKNMHKLWDILQDPYKNPIGAIVREYTSNAWDSHVEAGVKDNPIIVTIDKDDGGWFWSVEDFGVGMSEDRVEKVFVEYLETTKDLSNNEIGAFGIGSKSGLSYQDVVHYMTRYEGMEYTYMLRKGETAPTMDLLSKVATTKGSGTLVKVYIKESYRMAYSRKEPEVWKFKDECKMQLPYFHNVYFNGCDIDNDYKIYEGDHFKASTLVTTNKMHMCIGDVYYPIDWEQMRIDPVDIAVALKFSIGDLDLQFTREDVKYSQRTKDAIKAKISDFTDEVLTMWYSEENMIKDDIFDYYDAIENDEALLDLDGIKINIYNLDKGKIKKKFVFKPMSGIAVPTKYEFFVDYTVSREVTNSGSLSKKDSTTHSTYV